MPSSIGTLSPYTSDEDEDMIPVQLADELSPSEAYHFSLFSKYWPMSTTPNTGPPSPLPTNTAANWACSFTDTHKISRQQPDLKPLFTPTLLIVLPDCSGHPSDLQDKDWAKSNSVVYNRELPISLDFSEFWTSNDARLSAVETAMQSVSMLVVYGRDLSPNRPDVQRLQRLVWRTTMRTQFRPLPPK